MNVSVVVSVYNGERFIARAIRSLLDQSIPREQFEIVVVNDGSTDQTARVLESFGTSVRTLTLERRRGLPAACNAGIRACRGRYVVRVDADDYVHQDFLRIEYLFMVLNPEIDAVACDYYLIDERERITERRNVQEHPIACGFMCRTDDLIALGLYDEQMLFHEDTDLRIRFMESHNITRIQLPLYRYRRHDDNMTNDVDAMERYKEEVNAKHGIAEGT